MEASLQKTKQNKNQKKKKQQEKTGSFNSVPPKNAYCIDNSVLLVI